MKLNSTLSEVDPAIYRTINLELDRQRCTLDLIASENVTTKWPEELLRKKE